MAVVAQPVKQASNMLSQIELLKRLDPNGNVADIAEVLNETNEVIQDITFKEGNLPTGDEQSIRNGLPSVYWRQMNRGVPPSKSQVVQVTETCAEMSAQSILDVKAAELNGMSAQFRRSEETPFIESMGQKLAETLFYGDARTAEGFTGLASRYSTLDTAKALNAKNVINCGATSKSKKISSIYIVGWGDNVYCPYPKGSKIGLQTDDMGVQLVDDDLGNKYQAYVSMFSWNVGLMVRDWRYVVRLANIDVDALMKGEGIGAGNIQTAGTENILMKLDEALTKIPRGGNPKLAIYCNGDVHHGLNVVSARTNMNVITYEQAQDAYGTHNVWSTYKGIPLRQCDQIKNDEALVA